MHTTAKVMIEQERKLLEITEGNPTFGTPFHDYALLKALKPYINAEHLWQFYPYVEEELLGEDNYMNYVQNEREWTSNSAFVWCYSFWLRRYFEGNDHNIYKLLISFSQVTFTYNADILSSMAKLDYSICA